MICAIYARKSTEQRVADDAKSVTRQMDLARAYAAERGWVVTSEYVDDGISGALADKLVGRARMLAAAAEGQFQVLIVRDLDRLSRNDEELPGLIYSLRDSGVEIWCYADRARVDTRTALHRGMLSMRATFAAAEREAGQIRTREAMVARHRAGRVTGGRVYSYANVREGDYTTRTIVPAEADVIRRIFQEIADGRGYARVAQMLNREGVPSPTGRRWAMTGVRAMVMNPLYRGRVIYGRTRWEYRGGRKLKRRVPESEWLVLEQPSLRVVPEELWRAAHERLDRTRQTYLRQTGGRLYGRPESGIEGRHLLSGFLLCGVCEGAMHAIRRTSRRGEARTYYVCNNWRVNGACDNSRSVLLPTIDASVVEALRSVLSPDLVRDVIVRVRELGMEEPEAIDERRRLYVEEEARIRQEIARFTEAIAQGGNIPAVLDALRVRERRRVEVQAQLEHLDGLAKTTPLRPGQPLAREIQARLDEWAALLGRHPAQARQIVRRLIAGRLRMIPKGRHYEWEGQATYGALLHGMVGLPPAVVGLVPPG